MMALSREGRHAKPMRSNQPDDPELARFLREELGAMPEERVSCAVTGPVWRWQSEGQNKTGKPSPTSWFFITIAGDAAEQIRAAAPGRSAAWGSVYVTATIGGTRWTTSVFPSKQVRGYMLPLKAGVRKAEAFGDGDIVTVTISI
jgi:hypothetical protein